MKQHTRRTFLATTGGLTAGLAGCLGLADDGQTESPPTEDGQAPGDGAIIRDARVEETTLVVELGSDASVDRVTIIDPSGEAFADRAVTTGATRLTFEIGTRYRPGEYQINAVRDADPIAETTLDIEPEIEILDVRAGANHMDEMPDSMGTSRDTQAIVTVENSGTGPTILRGLWVDGDVPNPTSKREVLEEDGWSGIYRLDHTEASDGVSIAHGDEQTIYTSRLPFSWARTADGCQAESGQITVSVLEGIQFQVTSQQYDVRYSPTGEKYDCQIRLGDAA